MSSRVDHLQKTRHNLKWKKVSDGVDEVASIGEYSLWVQETQTGVGAHCDEGGEHQYLGQFMDVDAAKLACEKHVWDQCWSIIARLTDAPRAPSTSPRS